MTQTATKPANRIAASNNPLRLPEGLEFEPGKTNRLLIRRAWEAAGVCPQYPIAAREAIALLRIIGYDASPAGLKRCIDNGHVPLPDVIWDEADCIAFADALEEERLWQPMHAVHVHKYNPRERSTAATSFAQMQEAYSTYARWEPRDLIGLLVNSIGTEAAHLAVREIVGQVLMKKIGLLDQHV